MLNKNDKPASESAAGHSQYKKEKNQYKSKGQNQGTKTCRICRFIFHPEGKTVIDRSTCPARDCNCRKCQKRKHHASVCLSSKSSATKTDNDGDQKEASEITSDA